MVLSTQQMWKEKMGAFQRCHVLVQMVPQKQGHVYLLNFTECLRVIWSHSKPHSSGMVVVVWFVVLTCNVQTIESVVRLCVIKRQRYFLLSYLLEWIDKSEPILGSFNAFSIKVNLDLKVDTIKRLTYWLTILTTHNLTTGRRNLNLEGVFVLTRRDVQRKDFSIFNP